MLIGTNLALVVYGYFMGDILMDIFKQLLKFNFPIAEVLLNDFNLLSQTIISTIIILMTAQFYQKCFSNLFIQVSKIFLDSGLFFLFMFLLHF